MTCRLEISDEEERLVYIYSVIVIIYNKYTKLKTEIITNNYKKVFPFQRVRSRQK